jgi:hypothetical protein
MIFTTSLVAAGVLGLAARSSAGSSGLPPTSTGAPAFLFSTSRADKFTGCVRYLTQAGAFTSLSCRVAMLEGAMESKIQVANYTAASVPLIAPSPPAAHKR